MKAAFPLVGHSVGMTLRDYFAAHCPSDLANIAVHASKVELMGCDVPDGPLAARLAWNARLEAKLRYIYADAMLGESYEA